MDPIEVAVLCYMTFLLGVWLGVQVSTAPIAPEERGDLKAMVALADHAAANPEAIPRPPAEVERVIQMRRSYGAATAKTGSVTRPIGPSNRPAIDGPGSGLAR